MLERKFKEQRATVKREWMEVAVQLHGLLFEHCTVCHLITDNLELEDAVLQIVAF